MLPINLFVNCRTFRFPLQVDIYNECISCPFCRYKCVEKLENSMRIMNDWKLKAMPVVKIKRLNKTYALLHFNTILLTLSEQKVLWRW